MRNLFGGLILLGVFLLFGCTVDDESADHDNKALPEKGALTKAVIGDDISAVKKLLKGGANVNEDLGSEEQEITPLLAAVVFRHEAIAFLLLNWGAALHPSFSGYNTLDFARYLYGTESKVTRAIVHSSLKGEGE